MRFNAWLILLFLTVVPFFYGDAGSEENLTFLPGSTVIDNNEKVLAWHFVLRFVSLEHARWMVDRAHDVGFNTVVVAVTDGVRLDSAPWEPQQSAWKKEDFNTWVAYARSKGMDVIPEIKLLSHQEKFFQNKYPTLMYNTKTYDPRQDETYRQVFPLLDEIIALIQPSAFHIGHDEVTGFRNSSKSKWSKSSEPGLPAELFLMDVLRVHEYLKNKKIETWMWGDMLIDAAEFPTMLMKHFHGGASGYGKALRDKLPRDIVICDWHYSDDQNEFPSLAALVKEGFRVIGVTWKKEKTIRNFSRYAAQHGAYGMMATTWFHVQRKEWDVVENTINISGKIFIEDFTGAE